MKGNKNALGYRHTPEGIEKIRQASIKRGATLAGKYWFEKRGLGTPNWKGGIRKKKNERNDSAYHKWVSDVKKRDRNTCQMKGSDCSGYNTVHHVRPWIQYPEDRYKVINGITLCQFHHPRKRVDEQRLIPFFQGLVGSSEIT